MAALRDSLTYEPVELNFGTSGLRGLVVDMTDLECYLNTAGFLRFLAEHGQLLAGDTVLVAGDLRDSTPRIAAAVVQAVRDAGFTAEYHGLIPTPAIAYYALERDLACIMVTGSHIPADRNGIKFYKQGGEVLKADELPIKTAVSAVRDSVYSAPAASSAFQADGSFKVAPELPPADKRAGEAYRHRYLDVFPSDCLTGKKIVYYQHSAVGRDMLPDLLKALGAEVMTVGFSDVFVPLDSENVTPKDKAYFAQLAAENPGADAIVSTDGDSDRPFVIDETGTFHRGDVLGAVAATWCKADFAAYPVSASDAVDTELAQRGVEFVHTKVGSPYVIVAMQEAEARGRKRAVGWEVNGGFMLGTSLEVERGILKPLPTRDAFFPILASLLLAKSEHVKQSELFARLPQRFTDAALINEFPVDVSRGLVAHFGQDTPEVRAELLTYFSAEHGFDTVSSIDAMDGARITFKNGDVAHLRPSSNAPQLRVYSIADTPQRAAEITELAIAEPDGIFRRMQRAFQNGKEAA